MDLNKKFLSFVAKILELPFIRNTGSLKNKLFIFFFALMVFVATFISIASYYIFKSFIIHEIGRSRVDVLRQIGERTRVIKSSIIAVSNLYYYDEQIYGTISKQHREDADNRTVMNNLSEMAFRYQVAFEKINISFNTVLIGDNGFEFSSLKDWQGYDYAKINKTLWYRDVLKKSGDIFWVSSYDDSDDAEKSKYVFSAARVIKNKSTEEKLGLLLINMDERILFETYKNVLNGKNSIYIVDEKGSIVSHKDENMLGINFFDMKRFREIFKSNDFTSINKGNDVILLSNYFDPETQWTIVEEIPISELLAPLNKARYMICGIFILCTLLSLVLSFSFANKTAKPLKRFCLSMEKVRDGDLNVISDIKGWDELKQLSNSFNQMVERIKTLILDVKREERLKRKAELDFLQAQINPHFLYNTLLSIKCMVSMEKNLQAEEMLSAFTGLLKKTFNSKEELISLAEEIECLKQYALIQQYRYSNKFEIVYDVQKDILDYKILKLILQPIMENSIFHGIEAKKEMGKIAINIRKKKDEIKIRVIDDGVGMDAATIKAIWQNQDSKEERQFNMVGIVNVHQRIQMNFGIQYGLRIFSQLGKGTEIQINIPAIN